MDQTLKEELARSMFRFRKVGVTFPAELGVNMAELFVMGMISENGSYGSICMSDIQNELFITKPAVSQILNTLEDKGFIIREINKNDRRKIVLTLTPKGAGFWEKMREYTDNIIIQIISRFGEENMKQLLKLFNHFADISEEVTSVVSPQE